MRVFPIKVSLELMQNEALKMDAPSVADLSTDGNRKRSCHTLSEVALSVNIRKISNTCWTYGWRLFAELKGNFDNACLVFYILAFEKCRIVAYE